MPRSPPLAVGGRGFELQMLQRRQRGLAAGPVMLDTVYRNAGDRAHLYSRRR